MPGERARGQHPFPSCDVPIGIRIVQKSSVEREDRNSEYQYSEEQCHGVGRKDQVIFPRPLECLLGYAHSRISNSESVWTEVLTTRIEIVMAGFGPPCVRKPVRE